MSNKNSFNERHGFSLNVIEKIMYLAPIKISAVSGIQSEKFFLDMNLVPKDNIRPGYDIDNQCGEEDRIWFTLFMECDGKDDKKEGKLTWWAIPFENQTCIITGKVTTCVKMFIRLSEFTYVPDNAYRAPNYDVFIDKTVEVLGKRGRVVQSTGHQWSNRKYKTQYLIKFEDDTYFTALWWQIKVVGEK